MTLEELMLKLGIHIDESSSQTELFNCELQFHYDCIWYKIGDLDRIDEKNKRIILKSSKRWAQKDDS